MPESLCRKGIGFRLLCLEAKTIEVQKHRESLRPNYPSNLYEGLTIMISKLGLVQLTNRKTGKKVSRQTI